MQQKGIDRTYTKGNIRYYRKEYFINFNNETLKGIAENVISFLLQKMS